MAFFEVSLETANRFYTWGWRASIVSAIATAIALVFVYWGGRVRERDAAEQLSTANLSAAQANERAAALEVEAEQARLAQEQLKARLAWRTLSAQQRDTLRNSIINTTGSVRIAYITNDPEATFLAIQLSRVFEGTNWRVEAESRTYADRVLFGIQIPGPANPQVQALRQAFRNAGITFSTEDVPLPIMAMAGGDETDALIMIGSKSPPF